MLLEVKNIDSYYGSSHILFDVSLQVKKGQVVSLLGRNGAGKSTTLKSIMGIIKPKNGKVIFKGQDITKKDPFEIARRGLGFVPEDRRIFPNLTVKENLMVGGAARSTSKNLWDLDRIFSVFPVLKEYQARLGNQLSGGEQQMLTISRTLMGNPELLLLDEPSEGLAPTIVKTVGEVLDQICNDGLTVLLSEQNVNFSLKHSHFAYVIDDGRMCFSGSPRELEEDIETQCKYLAL